MDLTRDFKEFIECLNKNDVRYLVVGGYAVAFHGHPRYTKDMDLWIEPTKENARRVIAALDDFGFKGMQELAKDLSIAGRIVQLGYPPNRIDLLTSAEGLEFDQAYSTRLLEQSMGMDVPYLDLESLRKNKQAVDRPQDRADLEKLR